VICQYNMRLFSLLALDSYLKCAASKCSHEVLGMAADDDFVEVEVELDRASLSLLWLVS
jgi:hypothetical protein